MSSYLTMIINVLLMSFLLAAKAFAFTPTVDHLPSSNYRRLTAVQSSFAYEDWHASLHQLDDLGVEDDVNSFGWDRAITHTTVEQSTDSGLMDNEVLRAFLPVVMLILLEITYSLSTQT
mmetsp:Transcript_5325/g.12084  ORF Transcript_5325/g.12084 Transcript_5325/m.12084 type:complete len:119 (+) Transcript_5325:1-357(+)